MPPMHFEYSVYVDVWYKKKCISQSLILLLYYLMSFNMLFVHFGKTFIADGARLEYKKSIVKVLLVIATRLLFR